MLQRKRKSLCNWPFTFKSKNQIVLAFALVCSLKAQSLKAQCSGHVSLEALYWQASADDLTTAISSTSQDSLQEANAHHPHFDWDVGARIEGGIDFPSRYSLSLEATWLHLNAWQKKGRSEGEYIFPVWPLAPSSGYVDSYSQHWRLHLGIVDLAIEKFLPLSRSVQFIPILGLRYASFRQKDNMCLEGGTMFPDSSDEIRMKNKFWGLGPVVAAKLALRLHEFLSIYSKASCSLLLGPLYLHQDEDSMEGTVSTLKVLNTAKSTKATASISLGLESSYKLPSGEQKISAHLAWEQLLLFGQDQYMHFTSDSSQGSFFMNQGQLSLRGMVLGFRWSF